MRQRRLRIAVLDVETTGFSATNDRICEIAVVLVRNLELHGVYQTLVNPEVPIPEATSQVHGLFDHHVAHAATFREIAGAVGAVLRGSDLVVCHNVTFDLGFIQASLGRAGHPVLVGSTLCTLASAKQQWPAGPNKLAAVAARIGVTVPELAQHRAVDDAGAQIPGPLLDSVGDANPVAQSLVCRCVAMRAVFLVHPARGEELLVGGAHGWSSGEDEDSGGEAVEPVDGCEGVVAQFAPQAHQCSLGDVAPAGHRREEVRLVDDDDLVGKTHAAQAGFQLRGGI